MKRCNGCNKDKPDSVFSGGSKCQECRSKDAAEQAMKTAGQMAEEIRESTTKTRAFALSEEQQNELQKFADDLKVKIIFNPSNIVIMWDDMKNPFSDYEDALEFLNGIAAINEHLPC